MPDYWKNKVDCNQHRDLDPWVAVGTILGLVDMPGRDILVIPPTIRIEMAVTLWSRVKRAWKIENSDKAAMIDQAIRALKEKVKPC